MTKTAEQVVAEALVGTILTGSRVLSPEQREDVVAITVTALRGAGMLKDALDADTVDDRTEWDYDVVQRPEDCTTISSLAFPTLEKAKNWRQHLRNMGHGDRLIMRRRRAGEWEEIPNE